MKILIFTEGTVLTNKRWINLPREVIVKQVKNWARLSGERLKELQKSGAAPGLRYFADSVPIGNCVNKIKVWKDQGAVIVYLTSRRKPDEVEIIRDVLRRYNFPSGELYFRQNSEQYKDVAERVLPDVIVEDDCESIGGEEEMTYIHISPKLRSNIKSVVVKEFGGIDHLPDKIEELLRYCG